MGRAEDPQEPQEYHHDHYDSDAPAFEADDNQPAEMGVNFNIDHQVSYNVTNSMEPQANIVHEQYPPQQGHQPNPVQFPPPQKANPVQFPPPQKANPVQFPPPQKANPVQFPPQQNSPQGNPSPYPPPGSPMQFHPQATQPIQFPPAPSQEAHQPYNQPYNNISPTPQMGYYAAPRPQSPFRPAPDIPMQNQFPNAVAHIGTNPWRTGLFDCMDDPQNAIVTACFPCVTFGQIAEIIDNGHSSCSESGIMYGVASLFAVPCILSCGYRTKLRSKYGLLETPGQDLLTHCFCECCALCQEYRELNMRGLDPNLGWQGNLAKNNVMQQQQQQMGMKPPMNQSMNY